ncbi:hypothetical protein HWV62_39459 [Athelia sp. TMB]|nr:hypothetical protein HWV62_39459 [Athelia sp. TMB]
MPETAMFTGPFFERTMEDCGDKVEFLAVSHIIEEWLLDEAMKDADAIEHTVPIYSLISLGSDDMPSAMYTYSLYFPSVVLISPVLTVLDSLQIHAREPAHTAPDEQLPSRLQLGLVQIEIVDGADAQDTLSRHARAHTVHERAASLAEVVGHGVARLDGARLAPGREVIAAAQVLQVRIVDGEVGCEHGRRDFAAVRAVADEGVDQAGAFDWLEMQRCISDELGGKRKG